MRSHVTLTHAPESCPGSHARIIDSETRIRDWPARAKEVGVELIAAAICGPAHTSFFLVETDDFSKLHEMFRPHMGFNKADITPVRDLMIPQ